MAESNTRFFRDQRYPDQLISLEQLKKEYGEQIADGSIDPDELSFTSVQLHGIAGRHVERSAARIRKEEFLSFHDPRNADAECFYRSGLL